MKNSLLIITTFLTYYTQAQFAVVQDKDGFVNVRELENSTSQILAKVKTGSVLFMDPEPNNPNWILVEYKPESNGYIFHDRLKNIEDFELITASNLTSNAVNYEIDDYKISIEIKDFDKKNNKIIKERDFIYAINDLEIFGTDGMLPQKEFKSFKISYKGKDLEIPKKYYSNLYNVQPESMKLSFNKETNQYYLYGTFSDGAGSFDTIWVLENGKIVQHLTQISFYA